ncbi:MULTISPECIES: hypothetical protein [unclassified Nonomuraea]
MDPQRILMDNPRYARADLHASVGVEDRHPDAISIYLHDRQYGL